MIDQPIPGDLTIRPVAGDDANSMAAIYNYYIRETVVTFEEQSVSPGELQRRIKNVEAKRMPWRVAEADGLVGYAYATIWKSRPTLRPTAELSLYFKPDAAYAGPPLLTDLLEQLKDRGLREVIVGIALPDSNRVALFEASGLKKVAHIADAAMKFGRWIDVGYWQGPAGR